MADVDAPIRAPHAVIPHGQMRTDEGHSVVTPGQEEDTGDVAEPSIEQMRKMFDRARDLTNDARTEQEKCIDYYDGPKQLSAGTLAMLRKRGQPAVPDNRIQPAINGILGVIENAKVDPRGYPRNPADQNAADVCTKTLRYASDRARWQNVRMDCAEDYLKPGVCAAIVEFDGENVTVNQVRWESFFYDPRSRKNDFSDAKYVGIAKWMYQDEVRQAYPRAAELGDLTMVSDNPLEATFQDRPEDAPMHWVDRKGGRVMVVEMYYIHDGEWLRCVFCGAGTLEYGRSPYLDVRTNRTRCPIEAQSFAVDRENKRYGPIANMIPLQDEVNARRSRGLHLFNSRQIQKVDPSGEMVDEETVRIEIAKPDGIVPMGWQAIPQTDMAAGNLQMLAEAKESLQRMVPVAIAQDLREGSATSGRARQVAQQAGLTQFGRGFGRFADFEERIYRSMWLCAQQFWTGPMWVRVTDNPRATDFLQINEPVMGPVMQPVVGPDGQPLIDPMTGQPAMQQAMGQVDTNRRIAAMDMDIIIATTPDTVALEQEVFDSLAGLLQSGVDPTSLTFQVLLELMPIPDKAGTLERIENKITAFQQQQAQAMAAQQQMAQQNAKLDMAEKAARTSLTNANAQDKAASTARTIADLANGGVAVAA